MANRKLLCSNIHCRCKLPRPRQITAVLALSAAVTGLYVVINKRLEGLDRPIEYVVLDCTSASKSPFAIRSVELFSMALWELLSVITSDVTCIRPMLSITIPNTGDLKLCG